jgi:signal transduction histidine kinase
VKAEPNGLMLALQELAAMTKQIYHIRCNFHCPFAVRLQDNTAATHLYRIAQESVNNAIRHGKARHVQIGLTTQRSILALSVSDDGIGFRPGRPREGMGIRIMRYRTATIGGTFSICRRPSGGTEVNCEVHRPLHNHRFAITP